MSTKFRQKWKTYLASFVALGVAILVAAHFLIERSDAFDVAASFAKANPEVVRQAGAVRDVRLSWSGASIEVSGGSGSAQLTLNVAGATASPTVYVELRKRGVWEVTFARLLSTNGKSIVLRELAP